MPKLELRRNHRNVLTRFAWLALGCCLWTSSDALDASSGFHRSPASCPDCHLVGAGGAQASARNLRTGPDKLCVSCHAPEAALSHPSGVRVGRELPAVFPLNERGMLTCNTCHDVHRVAPGMLRGRQTGRALCEKCHATAFIEGMRDGAQSLVYATHQFASGNSNAKALDDFSLRCMTCHADETTMRGTRVASVQVAGRFAEHGGSNVNHPVGVRYARARQFGGYHLEAEIDKRILLPNGRMSCLSCHAGYSSEHGRVLLAGEQLCFQCHDL